MHSALQGGLIGLAIAAFLVVFEYMSVKKNVEERAAAKHQKPEWEPSDRSRVRAVVNYAIFVPFGLALIFWLLD
ncbi:MAG: hypothetical protein ACREUS_04485 [Burkholderiales bacterium]